jgi:hypothetical protein
MTNRFMMSVAAVALIAGTGFAYAQGTAAPSAGSTAQQSAPSSRDAAEPTKPSSGMKATQTEQKSPAAGKNERAEDNMQGQKSKSMSSDSDRSKSGSKEMKAEGRNGDKDMKAEGRDSKTGNMNADSKTGNMNAQTKGATDSKSQTTTGATDSKTTTTTGATDSKTTTGNAATSATAAPPAEKRTQIVSAIKSEKVEEVTNVNFNISVGATIPATVRFHRLPSRIVEIYPEWRGYEFILVHGRYIIVRPQTHEIVYIIEG